MAGSQRERDLGDATKTQFGRSETVLGNSFERETSARLCGLESGAAGSGERHTQAVRGERNSRRSETLVRVADAFSEPGFSPVSASGPGSVQQLQLAAQQALAALAPDSICPLTEQAAAPSAASSTAPATARAAHEEPGMRRILDMNASCISAYDFGLRLLGFYPEALCKAIVGRDPRIAVPVPLRRARVLAPPHGWATTRSAERGSAAF